MNCAFFYVRRTATALTGFNYLGDNCDDDSAVYYCYYYPSSYTLKNCISFHQPLLSLDLYKKNWYTSGHPEATLTHAIALRLTKLSHVYPL